MQNVRLGRGVETEYGTRYDGRVVDGRRSINITLREPFDADNTDTLYVNANGLSAGRGTMRLGAQLAAHAGFKAVTVDYTNRLPTGCLDSNARDIATVAEAFGKDHNVRGIGLSEGGLVLVRAMLLTKFQSGTLVNPAGIIEDHELSWVEGLHLVKSVAPEAWGYFKKNPVSTLLLGASCVANCLQRPLGVFGEMNELRRGNEHHNVTTIKSQEESPFMRVCWSNADNLLKAMLIEAGAQLLPVDERISFPGGHCDWATDPVLAQTVYSSDMKRFGPPSLSPPAFDTASFVAAA